MYIRKYDNYKKYKLNEEFVGKLLKKLGNKIKSKITIGLSKKLGSAKDVEKVIDAYKSELQKLAEEKKQKIKVIAELEKSKAEGGDVSDQIDKAVEAYKKSEEVYEKQKDNLKEKFDLQFQKIVKEEENPVIKDYIKLRKIEMVSDLLQQEMDDLNKEMGITEKDIESSEILQNIINSSKDKLEKVQSLKEKVEKSAQEEIDKNREGEGGNEEGLYKPGEDIKYTYTNKKGKEIENEATISDNQEFENDDHSSETHINIETERSKENKEKPYLTIKKDQIVQDEKKEEKPEETPKKDEGEGDVS